MAIKRGTCAADAIHGTAYADWLFGRGGNDRIQGCGGDDALWGDKGNDVLSGGAGADFLSGGAGNDRLDGGGIGNVLYGDDGNDTLIFNPRRLALVPGASYTGQHMEGGRGYDTLRMGADVTFVNPGGARAPAKLEVHFVHTSKNIIFVPQTDQGPELSATFNGIERFEFTSAIHAWFSLPLGDGADAPKLHAVGSPSDDVFQVRGEFVRVEGGGGSDIFDLSDGNIDVVLNRGMADRVTVSSLAEGGKHVYRFGTGDTVTISDDQSGPLRITEAEGSTTITGTVEDQSGSVVIDAVGLVRSGDIFSFGAGTVAKGAAPPAWPQVAPSDEPPSPKDVWGTSRSDTIAGTATAERIFAGGGDDRVTGGNGDDLIFGGGGHDRLFGGNGDDRLYGGAGNDRLVGGQGSNQLFGGDGADTLDGGERGGLLDGGAGGDTLVFDPGGIDIDRSGASSNSNGGAGFDVFRITNNTTYSIDPMSGYVDPPQPNGTSIYYRQDGGFSVYFEPDVYAEAGRLVAGFRNVERVEVSGHQPLRYAESLSNHDSFSADITAVGTVHDDLFQGGTGNETFIGGAGNDSFHGRAGNDVLISESNDADIFTFSLSVFFPNGSDTVTGFNGAGHAGGDLLRFYQDLNSAPSDLTVTEADGETLFTWNNDRIVVDAIGLIAESDYLIL